MNDIDIIDELERTPFSQLQYKDKLQIVKIGRPQPPLLDLKCEHFEKNRAYTRCFNNSNYKKYPWLTGSTKTQKLYCWACLLFSTDSSPWSKTGFNSLNYLVTACEKHQKSVSHIRAFSTLQTFGSQGIDHPLSLQMKISNSQHNDKVKENRNVLKRLIDVIAFMGKQECAFGGNCESEDSRNKGMHKELLKLLANYDPVIATHLKTSKNFEETSPVIQNDLIDAIASEIMDKIKSEIGDATFVALLLSETADVTNKSQLATIIRFTDSEGNCQERFLSFTDVSKDRTPTELLKHVIKTVADLNCSKKIVALTFDGAAVMSSHVEKLQSSVKEKYPSATFIISHSHRLNLVLSKCTNCISECRQFFNNLSAIGSFFSHSTARTTALKHFMERKLPGGAPAEWNFISGLTCMVGEYREHLIKFFLSIEEDCDNWTGEEVCIASGFVNFLCKIDTKFLLIIFKKIFAISDILFDTLQKTCMDIYCCILKVNEFYNTLQKIKDEDFDVIWEIANNDIDNGNEPKTKRYKNDECPSYHVLRYHMLFNEILDTLMLNVNLRFDSQKDIKFVSLLNTNNFLAFRKNFPHNLLAELKEPYASKFDIPRLKNELSVLYSLDQYKERPLQEITHYMKLNNLDIVFTEVYKLAELILTFPSTTAESSFSALKKINTYLRASQGQVTLSNLAMISIEKDVLTEIKKLAEEKFYENVTLKFIQKGRRVEFMFR